MIIENHYTGERIEFDAFETRLNRHRRRVKAYCDVINKQNVDNIMITLTYRDETEYYKRDITNFIGRLKRRCGKNLYGYTWVAEIQQRGYEKGGLHYHVIISVKKGFMIGKPDKTGLWKKGLTKVEKARTVYYVVKYTGKEYQKRGLPKGFRMYAVWISKELKLDNQDKWIIRKSKLPGWVVKIVNVREDWRREGTNVEKCKGSGYWIDGMLFFSPYWIISF